MWGRGGGDSAGVRDKCGVPWTPMCEKFLLMRVSGFYKLFSFLVPVCPREKTWYAEIV